MSVRVLIECGAAETRAACVDGDEIKTLWFGPAMGDEVLPQPPAAGEIFAGRVRSVSKPLNAAFVDIGSTTDGFLPLRKNEKPPVEGAQIIVIVRRPPIGEKGAVLSLDWRRSVADAELIESHARKIFIGALGDLAPSPVTAFNFCRPDVGEAGSAIVNDALAKRALEDYLGSPVGFSKNVFDEFSVDEVIEGALNERVSLPGGAQLHFHETAAGVLIDVDTASAGDGASSNLIDRTNAAAAARLLNELHRRTIGGRVIIDFLPPSTATARAAIAESLRVGLRSFKGARFGKIAPDGLADFTLPKRAMSLLERATEEAGSSWPVTGRRFTLDWSAKAAIRTLERDLRARPSARPTLLVGAEIAAYLDTDRPQWIARLQEKFGARFEIRVDAARNSRSHDLV